METVLEIINFFTDYNIVVITAILLFCLPLKKKAYFYLRFYPALIAYAFLPRVIPDGYFWSGFNIGSWFTIGFPLITIIAFLIVFFAFEIPSIKHALFYTVAASIFQHLHYTLYVALGIIIKPLGAAGLLNSSFSLILLIIMILIFYKFCVLRVARGEVIGISNASLIAFMIFSFFIIYILSIGSRRVEGTTIGMLLFDSFCCILLLILQFGLFEWSKLKTQNQVLMHIFHMGKQQHEESKENIEMINMKCHDIKHQIEALRHMRDQEEFENSIKELEDSVMIYDAVAKTGNETLDILLTEKSLFCEKHKIRFSYIADGEKLSFMSPVDIYTLFGNAIDNAVESVYQVEEPEKRVISLNISIKSNFLVIHMDNYSEKDPEFEDGIPMTTKADKDFHGYGMRSIKYITDKYNGTMSVNSANNIFALNIIFPAAF